MLILHSDLWIIDYKMTMKNGGSCDVAFAEEFYEYFYCFRT